MFAGEIGLGRWRVFNYENPELILNTKLELAEFFLCRFLFIVI